MLQIKIFKGVEIESEFNEWVKEINAASEEYGLIRQDNVVVNDELNLVVLFDIKEAAKPLVVEVVKEAE